MKKNPLTSTLDKMNSVFRDQIMFFRKATADMRSLPDFIIIGAQKAGTTSLYYYLTQHPQILPASKKEVHYFDMNREKGLRWYRSYFPTHIRLGLQNVVTRSKGAITGESTPYYLFHPEIPERVHQLVPNAKIIIMMRDPIDRAYSHYNHAVRNELEELTFEEGIRAEEERLKDNDPDSYNSKYFSYQKRGVYTPQLKNWLKTYPKEQILVLKSEDFYEDPTSVTLKTLKFLGLPECPLNTKQVFKKGTYDSIPSEAREYLQEYFKPHNKELDDFMAKNFSWSTPIWDGDDTEASN